MKHRIRLTLLVVGALITLLIVAGCQFGVPIDPVVAPLVGRLSPSRGHPEFDTTVSIEKTGGTFLYEVTGHDPVPSNSNTFDTTVDAWPWSCKVTWIQGDEVKIVTLTPTLVNSPPVIRKPRINGAFGLWKAWPYDKTTVFLNYQNDHLGHETGISDPDGDEWTLTGLEIKCDLNDEADTLFYPSRYGVEQYHIDNKSGCGARDVYPAAVWFPMYTAAEFSDNGLPKSPAPIPWYELLAMSVRKTVRWQNAELTITAEDCFGESSTERFLLPIAPLLQTTSAMAFMG